MFSRKRWIVGLGILVAGCCAAMPFQRLTMDGSSNAREPSLPFTSELQLHLTQETSPVAPSGSPAWGIHDLDRIQPLQIPGPVPASQFPDPVWQFPSIEDRYPPRASNPRPSSGGLPGDAPEAAATGQPAFRGAGGERFHRIQDGDTLRTLAKRYLGDAGRGKAIYDLNRSILASPNLLPLGQRLRIPDPR